MISRYIERVHVCRPPQFELSPSGIGSRWRCGCGEVWVKIDTFKGVSTWRTEAEVAEQEVRRVEMEARMEEGQRILEKLDAQVEEGVDKIRVKWTDWKKALVVLRYLGASIPVQGATYCGIPVEVER